jgi:hypothetical protein
VCVPLGLREEGLWPGPLLPRGEGVGLGDLGEKMAGPLDSLVVDVGALLPEPHRSVLVFLGGGCRRALRMTQQMARGGGQAESRAMLWDPGQSWLLGGPQGAAHWLFCLVLPAG